MKTYLLLLCLFAIAGCKQQINNKTGADNSQEATEVVKKKRPVAIENGKFFEQDGQKMLYGGEDASQHFNISGYALKDEQFHYGIGREAFPALLKPEFVSVEEANQVWADSTRFLVA